MPAEKLSEFRRLQQRFYRIYEASPDLCREDMIKLFKKVSKQAMLAEVIVDFLGKYDVNNIARELRKKHIMVSALDIFNMLEKLRKDGYLRVIGTTPPERRIGKIEAKTVSSKIIVPQSSPIPVPSQPSEITTIEAPPIETPEAPLPVEIEADREIQPIIAQPIVQVELAIPEHLASIVDGIRRTEIFERYLGINEHIKAIVLASREANIILHSIYRDIDITDTNALAFLATISEHSDRVSNVLDLGEFRETIIDATLYYIMLSRLKHELVLAAIFDKSIALGLMIRDFLSLKKEVSDILW